MSSDPSSPKSEFIFGKHLFDRFPDVSSRGKDGIRLAKKVGKFLKAKVALDEEYAR